MDISENQMQLMKHTYRGGQTVPVRNWFATDLKCADSIEFEKLVSEGIATSEKAPEWTGDDVIYRLTEKGILMVTEGK